MHKVDNLKHVEQGEYDGKLICISQEKSVKRSSETSIRSGEDQQSTKQF